MKPFLERFAELWQTGKISTSEYFAVCGAIVAVDLNSDTATAMKILYGEMAVRGIEKLQAEFKQTGLD